MQRTLMYTSSGSGSAWIGGMIIGLGIGLRSYGQYRWEYTFICWVMWIGQFWNIKNGFLDRAMGIDNT